MPVTVLSSCDPAGRLAAGVSRYGASVVGQPSPAAGPIEDLKGVQQVAHPRRGDRQRPAARAPPGRLGALQAQVKLALPSGQPLPCCGLQQRQLSIVVRGTDVLDVPRPTPRRVHDRRVADPAFPPDQRRRILTQITEDITSRQNLNQRRERTYPRVVKRPRHNSYHVKKPGDRGQCHNAPPTITLVNLAKPQAAA
jgi:hypothetical protein